MDQCHRCGKVWGAQRRDATGALLPDHQCIPGETQESITAWQSQTFPKVKGDLRTYILRCFEEFLELAFASGVTAEDLRFKLVETFYRKNRKLPSDWDESEPDLSKVPGEIADVAIVLYGVAQCAGVDLDDEVDKKMQTNRARKWAIRPDGCGEHVKGET